MKKYFDFQCPSCNEIQEVFCNESDIIICPECDVNCKKIFTPINSIVYQGKVGNYKNGYKSSPVNIRKT